MSNEESDKKKPGVLPQIIVAVVVALLVGGTAPWWWKDVFGGKQNNSQKPTTEDSSGGANVDNSRKPQTGSPGGGKSDITTPTSDFPGGSQRLYSAEFDKWPTPTTEHGSVTLGFGNSYVLQPNSNTWIGPGRSMEISPLKQDFVLDVRFRIDARNPSSSLSVDLRGRGTDADSVNVYFDVWSDDNVTYSIEKGRVRSGSLPIPHAIREQAIAEREQLPAAIKSHNWSTGSKLTLKREHGEMQFFVNDNFVKGFRVTLFPVEFISVGAAFPSTIVLTSIEARTKL